MNQNLIHRLRSVILVAALFGATICGARVFQRIPMAGSAALLARSLNARHAYSCDVEINDSTGRLSVLSARDDIDRVAAQCLRAFGRSVVSFRQSETMALGRSEQNDLVTRVLILQPDLDSPCTIVLLEQSQREYEQSMRSPARHAIDAVPEYPGSRPTFYVADTHTRFELATSQTRDAPQNIYATMQRQLAGEGWRPLLENRPDGPIFSGISLFQKGMDLCGVCVMRNPDSGQSTITLLHKRPGNE